MTKILALSDTHLEKGLSKRVVELAEDAEIILHAGDFVSSKVYLLLEELGRLEAVFGDADSPELKRLLHKRKIIEVEGNRIGLVHMASHSMDLMGAEMMAREMDVGILVFGHLHRPLVEQSERLLICPGSPTVPRMSPPTVAELEIRDGGVNGRIVPLGEPTCDYLQYIGSLAQRSPKNKSR